MACYQVNTMTLEAFNLKSKEILIEALKEVGYRPSVNGNIIIAGNFIFNLDKMQVEYPEQSFDLFKRIKNHYSRKVVEKAAKKKNWMLKKISENKYKATKF